MCFDHMLAQTDPNTPPSLSQAYWNLAKLFGASTAHPHERYPPFPPLPPPFPPLRTSDTSTWPSKGESLGFSWREERVDFDGREQNSPSNAENAVHVPAACYML